MVLNRPLDLSRSSSGRKSLISAKDVKPMRLVSIYGGAVAAAVISLASPCMAQYAPLIGPARVIDGDTLVINSSKIRLYGVDAPEKAQTCRNGRGSEYNCGQRSKDALTVKVGSKTVKCSVKNVDQYGRSVSVCSISGAAGVADEELNNWLVSNGLAVAYKQYSKTYVPFEEQARSQHLGIWEEGSFMYPADWRKQQKGLPNAGTILFAESDVENKKDSRITMASSQSNSMPSCPGGELPIKGNIGKKADKVFHKPSSAYYNQVKIDVNAGERYFCSEGEAQAAGWRESKR